MTAVPSGWRAGYDGEDVFFVLSLWINHIANPIGLHAEVGKLCARRAGEHALCFGCYAGENMVPAERLELPTP